MMTSRVPHAVALALLLSITVGLSPASAQLPSAELHTIYPAVATAGTTIDIDLTGTNLDELKSLQFSEPRIKAAPIMLPADDYHPAPRQSGNRFKITIPADIKAGTYEVRTTGYFGLSTARPFVVVAVKNKVIVESGTHSTPETATAITLDQTATGRTDADLFDYYKFTAKKGQRLLIHCQAERLDSRLDGLLILYDKNGRQLAKNQNHFGRDPMLDFTAKQDGEYFLVIADALYRGGAQYHYQIILTAKPHIDFIFPPAGIPGTKGKFTLYGRNLPGGSLDANQTLNGAPLESLKVDIQIPAKTESPAISYHPGNPLAAMLPGFDYRFKDSNTIRLGFAESPVVHEDSKLPVQKVTLPVEIAGRFDVNTDDDRYRFTAKKGLVYWVEAISNRIGSATDPYLYLEKITKPEKGEETYSKVAEIDDPAVVPNDSLNILARDSSLLFTADQDGDYQITIVNQYKSGDPSRLYRLAIRPAKPEFQILAVSERDYLEARQSYPAAALLRQGGNYAFRLIAHRRDGFDGDITVTASGLPAGVTAAPAIISGKSNVGRLIITAAANAAEWAGSIRLSAQATIGNAPVKHEVRTASVIWGTADYNKDRLRSRLTTQIPLAVTTNEKAPATLAPAENKKWTVEIGKKLDLTLKVTDPGNRKGNLTIQPVSLHGMKKPPSATVAEKKGDGKLTIDFTSNGNFKPEPGIYQFFLRGTGVTKYEHNPNAMKRAEDYKKKLEKLTTDVTALSTKATADQAKAKAAFDLANKTSTTSAATAKADMTKKVAAAKTALDTANKNAVAETTKATATKVKTKAAFDLANKTATTIAAATKADHAKKIAVAKTVLDTATKNDATSTPQTAAAKTQAKAAFDLANKNAATADAATKADQAKKVAAAKTALDAATKNETTSIAKTAATKVQAQKTFDLASKNANAAIASSAAEQVKKVAAAKTTLDTATKTATTTKAKTAAVTKEKTAAIAAAKAATVKAKVKDVKFAVYSPPITIEIKEKPKPPEKKK